MKVKNKDIDFELSAEELRLFKINNAQDLSRFVETITHKDKIGFEITREEKHG